MPNTMDLTVDDLTNWISNAAIENVTMTSGKRVHRKRIPWQNVDGSRMAAETKCYHDFWEESPQEENSMAECRLL